MSVHLASNLLLQSPPGEVNDVFNDLRVLVDNDTMLQTVLPAAFSQYNMDTFTTAKPKQHSVILSAHNMIGNDGCTFIDPKSKVSFSFDHTILEVSDVQDATSPQAAEPLRLAMEDAMERYAADHYPDGVCSVFGKEDGSVVVCIVDNKFSPNNFWNGRWQSSYTVDTNSKKVTGEIKVLVHYYEDGNVQLNSTKTVEFEITGSQDHASVASIVSKTILKQENLFQSSLNENYAQLSDNAFKALRRALPVFRTKIDWNTIGGYKIKNELPSKA